MKRVTTGSRQAFTVRNFSSRLKRAERLLAERDDRLRLLAPFDPLVRDRARALRLFGFDYRFEAYVPKAKRQFGYYVMPILQGEKIVGRCDLKTDRKGGEINVLGLWWEGGKRPTKKQQALFDEALARLEEAVVG